MRYLLINGSPHKGNTWKLAELVRDCLKELSPGSTFEELHLSDLKLPFCLGCSLCFRKGREYCPHNDIMKIVTDKLEECDGLIFAATTFNMMPNALTKNLIDHLCFMMHRPNFFRKKAIVLSTTGAVGCKSAVKYIASTLNAIGFNRCYRLPVSAFSYNNFSPDEKIKARCKKLALKFDEDVSSGKMHAPGFGALIPYNLFRGMCRYYAEGTEYETHDGTFWTDPERAESTYGPSIPVPVYKKAFGSLFCLLGKTMGKRMIITYKK